MASDNGASAGLEYLAKLLQGFGGFFNGVASKHRGSSFAGKASKVVDKASARTGTGHAGAVRHAKRMGVQKNVKPSAPTASKPVNLNSFGTLKNGMLAKNSPYNSGIPWNPNSRATPSAKPRAPMRQAPSSGPLFSAASGGTIGGKFYAQPSGPKQAARSARVVGAATGKRMTMQKLGQSGGAWTAQRVSTPVVAYGKAARPSIRNVGGKSGSSIVASFKGASVATSGSAVRVGTGAFKQSKPDLSGVWAGYSAKAKATRSAKAAKRQAKVGKSVKAQVTHQRHVTAQKTVASHKRGAAQAKARPTGPYAVKGYSRHSKTGKMVSVKGFSRKRRSP